MLDTALDQLDPTIANILFTAIMASLGGLGWFGILLRQLLKTKQAQNSLHMALDTGVDWVTDQIADLATGSYRAPSREQIRDKLLDYVKGSVPDSLKTLRKQATPEQLMRMAEARINVRMNEIAVFGEAHAPKPL